MVFTTFLREAGGFKDGSGVGEALTGLLLHTAFREGARCGVDGKLAGNKNEPGTATDSLAIRSDGRRGLV